MSKKQTTNTFGKGMMLDLHPLTVPSDVLTDALNATTITMNGNEGILQNDMGNGRVESAFLPPGYVPVGIKEYGGIIYVASYNPVTNKSQIGSFPSPERNIDQTEEGQLDNPLELLNTQYKRNYKFNEFNTYDNGSLQIGLGGLTNKVEIFGDNISIRSVCNRLNINSYHLFNMISDRVNIEYSGEELQEALRQIDEAFNVDGHTIEDEITKVNK